MDEHNYAYTEPWYISDWILIVCGIAIFVTPHNTNGWNYSFNTGLLKG